MTFQVIVQPRAEADLMAACGWIAEKSPASAGRWLRGLREAINSLRELPTRCPVAPESDFFDDEVRELLYGKRGGVYRILFTVHADKVHVVHVRHAARPFLGNE